MAYVCPYCSRPEGDQHNPTFSCGHEGLILRRDDQTAREAGRVRDVLERARSEGRGEYVGAAADRQWAEQLKAHAASKGIELPIRDDVGSIGDQAAPPRESAFEYWRARRSLIKQQVAAHRRHIEEGEDMIRRIEDLLPVLADMHE